MDETECLQRRNGALQHEDVTALLGAAKFQPELRWFRLTPTALQVAQHAFTRPSIGIARHTAPQGGTNRLFIDQLRFATDPAAEIPREASGFGADRSPDYDWIVGKVGHYPGSGSG
jgi:hypothetical protein